MMVTRPAARPFDVLVIDDDEDSRRVAAKFLDERRHAECANARTAKPD